MSLELLNEKDVININIRTEIFDELEKELDKTRLEFTKKTFEKYTLKYYNELKNSDDKLFTLIQKYRSYDSCSTFIMVGVIFFVMLMFVLLSNIYNGVYMNVPICFIALIVSILSTWYGVYGVIARYKIKKNFKSLGLKDML